MSRGTFIAVVGPSGAGKDLLISGALAARADLVQARRVITRPPSPETEAFDTVDAASFAEMVADGRLALHWQAHGLSYGIRAAVEADLDAGRCVLANLSRSVIGQARARFNPFRVIVVTAPPDVLALRLARRGRESAEEIAARLQRAGADMPTGPDVITVMNDAGPEDGIARFLTAISGRPARADG